MPAASPPPSATSPSASVEQRSLDGCPARWSFGDFLSLAALASNGCLLIAFMVMWPQAAFSDRFWRADFTAFYLGGRMVLQGDGVRLYALGAQEDHRAQLWPRSSGKELLPFISPPHAALLFVPFARLDCVTAFSAWSAVNLGLLLLFIRFLRRHAAGAPIAAQRAIVVTVLAFPALYTTFLLGQLTLLSVVALFGFCAALRSGRQGAAGMWLVLGSVKPQLMLVPGLILLAGRRWRALASAAALFALWGGATTLVLGPSCWPDFLAMLGHCTWQFGRYGIQPLSMYNFKGLFTAMLGTPQAPLINVLTLAASAASVVLAAILWLPPWPRDRRTFDQRLALTLLAGLLASPHLNPADALACVVPAVLMVSSIPPGRFRRWLALLGTLAPLLFLIDCGNLPAWFGGVRPFFLLLLVWCGWLAWQTRQPAPAGAPVPATT
jgi:hypothetical protein